MNRKLALFIAVLCTQLLICTIPMVYAADSNKEQLAMDRFPKLDISLDSLDKQKMSIEEVYSPLAYESTVVVTVKIIWDDNLWEYYNDLVGYVANPYTEVTPWVVSILEDGDDPFESTFDIDYQASLFAYWRSTNCSNMVTLFNEGRANFGSSGCDVRVFMTGQDCGGLYGLAELPGNDFIMTVDCLDVIPRANLWQHEASHNYGCPDHIPGVSDFCIMSYYWAPYVRNWCGGCSSIINTNREQFD